MSGQHDWQAGDLALCIKMGPWKAIVWAAPPPQGLPQPGCVYHVAHVSVRGRGELVLELEEFGGHDFSASRFIKIPPLTDEERDEFLADLNVPVRAVMPLSSAGDAA